MRSDEVQITVTAGDELTDAEARGLLSQLDREVPNWTGAIFERQADGTWNVQIEAPEPDPAPTS